MWPTQNLTCPKSDLPKFSPVQNVTCPKCDLPKFWPVQNVTCPKSVRIYPILFASKTKWSRFQKGHSFRMFPALQKWNSLRFRRAIHFICFLYFNNERICKQKEEYVIPSFLICIIQLRRVFPHIFNAKAVKITLKLQFACAHTLSDRGRYN